MKKRYDCRRGLAAAGAAVLSISIILAGCGKSGSETEAPSTEPDIITFAASGGLMEPGPLKEGYKETSEMVRIIADTNLYADESTGSAVIARFTPGIEVLRVGIGEEWSVVLFNYQNCFVKNSDIEVSAGDSESSSEESVSPEETTSLPVETTAPAAADGGQEIPTMAVDMSNIAALSNESIPWGYSSKDRDEQNRPNGCIGYQKKYGGYGADFLRADSKTIYLTFDEGYENGCTPAILDTLKEKNCKAVFFVTMPFAKQNPELVQRIIDEGHVLGSHSVTHPSAGLPSQDLETQKHELMDLHEYIKSNFGYEMYLFRYPAGIFSEQSLALVNSLGYRSVFWSFAHKDWEVDNQPDPAETLQRVTSQLHPGAIYLLHAVSTSDTQALAPFIDEARAQGYTFGYYSKR